MYSKYDHWRKNRVFISKKTCFSRFHLTSWHPIEYIYSQNPLHFSVFAIRASRPCNGSLIALQRRLRCLLTEAPLHTRESLIGRRPQFLGRIAHVIMLKNDSSTVLPNHFSCFSERPEFQNYHYFRVSRLSVFPTNRRQLRHAVPTGDILNHKPGNG